MYCNFGAVDATAVMFSHLLLVSSVAMSSCLMSSCLYTVTLVDLPVS